MKRLLGLYAVLLIGLCVAGCTGNRSPQTVAANVAHNGTILVGAIDTVQDFVIGEEKAGRLPTPQARSVMVVIGRALDNAKKVPPYLDKLASLPTGSTDATNLAGQVQAVLTLVASDVGQMLVPIGDEATRKQVAALAVEISKVIGTINGWVLQGGVK